MARGMPANKHFKVHILKRALAIELIEPASSNPVVLVIKGSRCRFYYKAAFKTHHKPANSLEIHVTSNQYLALWAYCLANMGSDYTLWQRAKNLVSSTKAPKSEIMQFVSSLICKNSGTRCPNSFEKFKFKDYLSLLTFCANKATSVRYVDV